jgi:hypothetical protein
MLAMAGCAERPAAVAVDLAPLRCPALRPADTAPFAKKPLPAPAGDMTASKLEAWIDGRELQLVETQRAGSRLSTLYLACAKQSRVAQAQSGDDRK